MILVIVDDAVPDSIRRVESVVIRNNPADQDNFGLGSSGVFISGKFGETIIQYFIGDDEVFDDIIPGVVDSGGVNAEEFRIIQLCEQIGFV